VRECRVIPVELAVTTLVCFFTFAREAAGAIGTRHSPRPLDLGEMFEVKLARTCGEIAKLCLASDALFEI
jgi:hypothetical protein